MGWGAGNIGGGGSGGLNFRIVGGTSEPSNPRENLIWVNTDVKIPGWVFSANEPENPESGMIWISTGSSSPVAFNALKKNGIVVFPISAKQYIAGESTSILGEDLLGEMVLGSTTSTDSQWVDVTAKSYQGGEWVEWCEVIPLTADYWTPDLVYGGTCEFRDGKAYLTKPYNAGYGTGVYLPTSKLWDLSTYSRLEILCSCTFEMSVCIDNNESGWDGGEIVSKTIPVSATEQAYTLDISSVSSGYIRINLMGNAKTDAGTGTVSAVRLYA